MKLPESREAILDFLQQHGALKKGHFLLASGRHSAYYVQKGLLVQHARLLQEMIEARLPELQALGKISVVLSPAVGGIPVGQQVALALNCRHIYAERDAENKLVLKRGFSIEKNESVLMVEDVITTGGTLVELKEFVEAEGGSLAGVFTVVNRSGKKDWRGEPMVSCLEIDFPTYAPDDVPEELSAIPLERPGTKKIL